MDQFSRTRRLLGEAAMARLARAHVAVFGVGGVGGHAAEALARCGVGALDLFDGDRVTLSNLNRQLVATHSQLGRLKVDALADRLRDIQPALRVTPRALFYLPENAGCVDLSVYDFIVDAVDTLAAKVELAVRAQALGVPIVSALGAGNRLDPARLRITDLFATQGCPLARALRQALRRRGVTALPVAFSDELPRRPLPEEPETARDGADAPSKAAESSPRTPASSPFVPPAMGLLLASYVVRTLTGA